MLHESRLYFIDETVKKRRHARKFVEHLSSGVRVCVCIVSMRNGRPFEIGERVTNMLLSNIEKGLHVNRNM